MSGSCPGCGGHVSRDPHKRGRKFVYCSKRCAAKTRSVNGGRMAADSGKRRGVCPVTSERDYSGDEFEFLKAVERYKREAKRPFPTLGEILEVARSLGYRKVAPPEPLPGKKCPPSSTAGRAPTSPA
jgi:hypothetical protein